MIIAGTGHRPDKLGGYGLEVYNSLVGLARDWLLFLDEDPSVHVQAVISGMALGWDQALADAAIAAGIGLHAYIPFKGQESKWPLESRNNFNRIIGQATKVVECSEPGYAAWKMQHRNKRMVDDCDAVLALWNGSEGGTANCVAYAEKHRKPIINLWEQFETRYATE